MAAPAPSTTARTATGFADRLRGSDGSSSPSIFTYPPKGMALRVYSVSPRRKPKIRGGSPMPNSSTLTPASFAVMKWPSSWKTTRGTKTAMKAIMVVMMPLGGYSGVCREANSLAQASASSTSSRDGYSTES